MRFKHGIERFDMVTLEDHLNLVGEAVRKHNVS